MPAIGFAMGDVVIMDILEELKLLPELKHEIDYIVIPFNKKFFSTAVKVANKLREAAQSLKIETYMGKPKLKIAFDYANRVSAKKEILIAPTEWERGEIVIKDFNPCKKIPPVQFS